MIVYLAQPYSHPEKVVRQARFEAAVEVSKLLMLRGISPLSPIAHSHYMDTEPHASFEVYQEMDEAMIRASDEVWVLAIPGWQESRGVASELQYAVRTGTPVRLIGMDGEFVVNEDILLGDAI